MEFYVHYQESVDESNVLCNNIQSLDDLCDYYGDERMVEHILNNIGKWVEVAIDENDKPLFCRVKYIVSKANLNSYIDKHTEGAAA
jgi:hypothetical protein